MPFKTVFLGLMAGLAAMSVKAQEVSYVSDAFGLMPVSAMQETPRMKWSGAREVIAAHGADIRREVETAAQTDTLLLFVGPKSPVAGKDDVHAVAVALDTFGNLVSNETGVAFAFSSGRRFVTDTRFGVANEVFLPTPRTGSVHAGATSDARQSARGTFRVVPDLASMDVQLVPPGRVFPREAFAEIETDVLQDQFGNPVGDGVNVQLLGSMIDGGYTLANGSTVAESAKLRLLTRAMGPQGQFQATLTNQRSAAITLETAKLSTSQAPDVWAQALAPIGALQLSIGPFLSDTGFMLHDGTPVRVSVRFRGNRRVTLNGWLRDGYFEALVPGGSTSLPADFEIHTETGVFHHRLEHLADTLSHRSGKVE